MDRKLNNRTRIIKPYMIHQYSKYGYYIAHDDEGRKYLFLTKRRNNISKVKYHKILIISSQELYQNIENEFSEYNTHKALSYLKFLMPNASAYNVGYKLFIFKFILCSMLIIFLHDGSFIFINHLVYFSQNLLKSMLFFRSQFSKYHGLKTLYSDIALPIYTILIPLYKEQYGARAILHYMNKLDYPKDLLDIKLVIEADDFITINGLMEIDIGNNVHIIKVPYSLPRTKPKALNYAMQYIKGNYMVIYDVEDRPEPDQLLKALHVLLAYDNVICAQGKLRFYNHNTNLLTKFFDIEYQIWFDYLLPAMEKCDIPVPLGGNSNHFKVDAIRRLGLWDPYNVTEDADLGLRLFMHGFRTKIIDSYSFEEAPSDLKNWIYQRARWIKGFIQTFLVYLNQSRLLKSKMSIKSRITIVIFVGFSSYSFVILPWYLVSLNNDFVLNKLMSWFNIIATFLYMYLSVAIVMGRQLRQSRKLGFLDYVAFILWPTYFILHTIASYKALFEIVTKPFGWNKTKHKISDG